MDFPELAFMQRCGEADALECVETPEWGDKGGPAKVFYRPMTLKDLDALSTHARKGEGNGTGLARIVALKALNEKGDRLFQMGHTAFIAQHADWQVIKRIADAISGGLPEDEAAALGN